MRADRRRGRKKQNKKLTSGGGDYVERARDGQNDAFHPRRPREDAQNSPRLKRCAAKFVPLAYKDLLQPAKRN